MKYIGTPLIVSTGSGTRKHVTGWSLRAPVHVIFPACSKLQANLSQRTKMISVFTLAIGHYSSAKVSVGFLQIYHHSIALIRYCMLRATPGSPPPPPAARKPRSPSLSSMWSSQSRADLFPPCRALQAASKHFTPANRPLTTSTRLRLATPAKHPLSTLHADSPPCPAAQWAFDDAVIPHSRIPTALRLHMQRHSRRFPTHAPTRALPSVPLFHPPVKYCTHRPTELPHHRFHCPALPATTDGDQTAPQWFDANTAHLDIATLPTSQARSCRALCWPTSPTSRHQPALAPLNPTRRPSCRHVLPKSPARSQCAAERSGPRDAQFAVQLPATLTTPAPIPAPASPRPPARAWHAQQQWPRASRVL